MKTTKLFRAFFAFIAAVSLTHCAQSQNPRVVFPVVLDSSTTTTVTTTTLANCSPNPTATVMAVGQAAVGAATTIRFSGWGMCNNQFRVVGFSGTSSALSLDITDAFYYSGTQVRQYSLQMVDTYGNAVGAAFNVVLNLTVVDPNVTTTTLPVSTTTTTVSSALIPPTCTLERVVDALHPATSNLQQSIWVRFNVSGVAATSTLKSTAVSPGIYEIRSSWFPFFEMQGLVSNAAGSSTCQLSVQTSYCTQSVVGSATATSVSTELTAMGQYDQIYIGGGLQSNPIWLSPWVVNTETFASLSYDWSRTTSGLVRSVAGDSWSCPVTYDVPAGVAPAPVYSSYMDMGQFLYAGDQLVPSGANVCGCRAVMQGDGNFVVYRGNAPLWSSHTYNNPGAYFAFQTDGNMVVYNGSKAKWSSSTNHRGAWQLHMQGDCNLVVYTYNFSTPLWSSHSAQSGCY
jgi:hypothetical protein